ncbi:MAG: ATP-binding protein [Bdellovibrionales bacterium]
MRIANILSKVDEAKEGVAYALALGAVGLALQSQYLLHDFLDGKIYLFLYPTVFFCSRLLGFGPGVFATTLAAAGIWYLGLEPLEGLATLSAEDYFSLCVFWITGILFSYSNHLYFVVRDQGRRATAQLIAAKEAAEAANLAKTQFLTNVSHEIRTPLGIIIGFADLALGLPQTPETKSYLKKIKHHGQQLNRLLGEVLDLAKVEANRFEVEEIPTNLIELSRDVLGFLELKAREKNLKLVFQPDRVLPKMIITDPVRLRQILVNLIGNAIKFTEKGQILVTLRNVNELVPSHPIKIEFEVSDTGVGIPQNYRGQLFRSFSQADNSLTRRHGGSGLGLMISQKLAQALGGDLALVRSEEGQGSLFRFWIEGGPFDGVFYTPDPDPTKPFDDGPDAEISETALTGKKILVVEDAVDNQILIEHYLKAAGGEVELASNGEEAIPMAMSGEFDLVLMDLQMPILDGYQATHQLREKGFREPIVALTAHALREEKRRALANGFNAYLTKPVNRQSLIDTLAGLDR